MNIQMTMVPTRKGYAFISLRQMHFQGSSDPILGTGAASFRFDLAGFQDNHGGYHPDFSPNPEMKLALLLLAGFYPG
jgi:hypothetical protein